MPGMDYKALAFWLHCFEMLCIGVLAIYSWLANRHKANAAAIDDLNHAIREELNSLDDRTIKIEKTIEHLPTQRDMADIHRRIDECAQEVRKLEGTLVQVNNSVQMIHQHLLTSKKG